MTTRPWKRYAKSGKLSPRFPASVLSHKSGARVAGTILSILPLQVAQTGGIRIFFEVIRERRDSKTRRNMGRLYSQQEALSPYGNSDHHAPARSVPAALRGSDPGMIVPSKKNHFLGHVLHEFSDGLYGYAMVLSCDRTEAEDLVQETCVRAIQAIDGLRPGSNVKSWLFTILRNVWLNRLRGRRSAPKMVELDGDENTAQTAVAATKDPHALFVSKVERELVREAIQQLSREFREIIVLREYEDLSYQEIANILGCPAGTVMSRLGRARSKLRSLPSRSLRAPNRREKGARE
jgi:RNA polymerase sigma-70 factor (ECF subfamily)